ncbi:hypothetical protein AALP_AA6G298700 [Arabis alpina]|uniref:Uncharacterized protein n=1 Tax=Arabis alpina TaxID=50452 RepID=A0A087GSM2_ARAAL|nr:hypothetical protein AALP_AA6G298700 [Arabis alpina]
MLWEIEGHTHILSLLNQILAPLIIVENFTGVALTRNLYEKEGVRYFDQC